jgi:hypothetical protein
MRTTIFKLIAAIFLSAMCVKPALAHTQSGFYCYVSYTPQLYFSYYTWSTEIAIVPSFFCGWISVPHYHSSPPTQANLDSILAGDFTIETPSGQSTTQEIAMFNNGTSIDDDGSYELNLGFCGIFCISRTLKENGTQVLNSASAMSYSVSGKSSGTYTYELRQCEDLYEPELGRSFGIRCSTTIHTIIVNSHRITIVPDDAALDWPVNSQCLNNLALITAENGTQLCVEVLQYNDEELELGSPQEFSCPTSLVTPAKEGEEFNDKIGTTEWQRAQYKWRFTGILVSQDFKCETLEVIYCKYNLKLFKGERNRACTTNSSNSGCDLSQPLGPWSAYSPMVSGPSALRTVIYHCASGLPSA